MSSLYFRFWTISLLPPICNSSDPTEFTLTFSSAPLRVWDHTGLTLIGCKDLEGHWLGDRRMKTAVWCLVQQSDFKEMLHCLYNYLAPSRPASFRIFRWNRCRVFTTLYVLCFKSAKEFLESTSDEGMLLKYSEPTQNTVYRNVLHIWCIDT